jgi:hypothetical protein
LRPVRKSVWSGEARRANSNEFDSADVVAERQLVLVREQIEHDPSPITEGSAFHCAVERVSTDVHHRSSLI